MNGTKFMPLRLVESSKPNPFAVATEATIAKLDTQVSKLAQTQQELYFCISNISRRPVFYMVKFESDVCAITAQMAKRLLRVSRLIRAKQYAIKKLKTKLREK